MNTEEMNQVTSMMSWGDGQKDVESMELKMYKRYNAQDSHYETRYRIRLHRWLNDKHVVIEGESDTVLNAMRQLVGKM
jgi:hypothetical protein